MRVGQKSSEGRSGMNRRLTDQKLKASALILSLTKGWLIEAGGSVLLGGTMLARLLLLTCNWI
jgi:hypothetical protein